MFGTPGFMAPEQARGEPVDARADVYALGATLFTCSPARPPYHGGAADAIVNVARAREPISRRSREVPAALARDRRQGARERASDRYADAGELAADLPRFLAGQLVAAHPYTTASDSCASCAATGSRRWSAPARSR